MAKGEEEKEKEEMEREKVEGRQFHELDAALICDELAG